MSLDPTFPPEPPRSSGLKVLLVLGVGCGILLLVCCGGGTAIYFLTRGYFQKAFSEDPAVVEGVGRGIAELDIPPALQPKASVNLKIPGTDQQIMTMAIFEAPNGAGTLFLAEFPGDLASADTDQLKEQLERQMADQGRQGQGPQELVVSRSRPLDVEIRGKSATFTIETGVEPQSNIKYTRAVGAFQGKKGVALVVLQLRADQYSDERVDEIIRSIK